MKTNYSFIFSCYDNGGKYQAFRVKAKDKPAAIEKAFQKAKKAAKGDITAWECRLQRSF